MTDLKNGWWKAIAVGSLAVNLTVMGLLVTWIQVARHHITIEEAQTLIEARVNYPWNNDRGLVMQHLTDAERHESDMVKRNRIRQEQAPVTRRLDNVDSRLRRIEDRLDMLLGQEGPNNRSQ